MRRRPHRPGGRSEVAPGTFERDLPTLPFGEDVAIPGVRIIRAANPFALGDMPIGPSFWKAVYDLILLWHAWRLAGRNRYQVVHCIEDAGVIGLVLRRVQRCGLVFEKHSEPASYRGGVLRNLLMLLYRNLETQAIGRADAVLTGPALLPLARSLADHERVYAVCSTPSTIRSRNPPLKRQGAYSYPELKKGLEACYADLQRRLGARRGGRLRPGRSTA